MEALYTIGTHLEQGVQDMAPTGDFQSSTPSGTLEVEDATQNFYVHPGTSGFLVELDTGMNLDVMV